MKRNSFLFLLLLLSLAISRCPAIHAQEISKQLVFTKMTLDRKNTQIWFEVLNPTNENIRLSSFRISGIRTPNILPPEIRLNKGIDIKPGERLIICGDKQSFERIYGNTFKVVEVKLLQSINGDGFVAMNFMEGMENSRNIIRFGRHDKSSKVAKIVGDDQLLNFTDGTLSFVREINANGELSPWAATIPNPGKNK